MGYGGKPARTRLWTNGSVRSVVLSMIFLYHNALRMKERREDGGYGGDHDNGYLYNLSRDEHNSYSPGPSCTKSG